MDLFERIRRALEGGRDELSRDNIVQLVVEQVVALRERGRQGAAVLPPEVTVTLTVPEDRAEVVRGFVDDPRFDRDVQDDLLNRLAIAPDQMPIRLYAVRVGDAVGISATGRSGNLVVKLSIIGGDRHGHVHLVPAHTRMLRMGRGPWHGADQRERNDIVLSDADAFVSRRAARLRRAGAGWEVETLDQGKWLVVVRADGTRVFPHHVPVKWVSVRGGDQLELNDGEQNSIVVDLQVERLEGEQADGK